MYACMHACMHVCMYRCVPTPALILAALLSQCRDLRYTSWSRLISGVAGRSDASNAASTVAVTGAGPPTAALAVRISAVGTVGDVGTVGTAVSDSPCTEQAAGAPSPESPAITTAACVGVSHSPPCPTTPVRSEKPIQINVWIDRWIDR